MLNGKLLRGGAISRIRIKETFNLTLKQLLFQVLEIQGVGKTEKGSYISIYFCCKGSLIAYKFYKKNHKLFGFRVLENIRKY